MKKYSGSNKYYLHEIVDGTKKDETMLLKTETAKSGALGNIISSSKNKLSYTRKNVKIEELDSKGNKLSKQQVEFFKNTKVRDENGKLIPMYHGTNTFGS